MSLEKGCRKIYIFLYFFLLKFISFVSHLFRLNKIYGRKALKGYEGTIAAKAVVRNLIFDFAIVGC